MIALGLLALLTRQNEPLPLYADARRCSGLATAHHKAGGADAPDERTRFDAAMFWALAASERARKDHMSSKQFERDQLDDAKQAGAELAAGDASAAAELTRCVARVPPLKPH